jgi:tetratricopeptide (TPR) repeat protein
MLEMKHSKLICIFLSFVSVSFLISCAGTDVKKGAQSEFESGISLFYDAKYEESIPHFERATELFPEFGKAYLYLGRSYLKLGKWKEALQPLRTAFRLDPVGSNNETDEIIVDVFFKNPSKVDQDTQSQIMDILNLR